MIHSHDALYRAICAMPDEDTPRLAYADLIEEEGDDLDARRAAFIRAQIALANAREYDPLYISTKQLDPDVLYGWGMAHALPRVPGGYGWEKFEFRRGFPWKVGVQSLQAFVGDGGAVFATAPIQALDIFRQPRLDIAALAEWPHLSRIRRLEFSVGYFGAEEAEELGNSEHALGITELGFESDGITSAGLEALARTPLFSRISSLELRSNAIAPALLVDSLAATRDSCVLSSLSLAYNRLTHYDAAHLFALPILHGLESLDLSDNMHLGPEGIQSLGESGIVRNLRVLKVAKTLLGVPGIRALTESPGLTGVRSLDLSANRLGPVAIKLIAESDMTRELRVLNLANNHVGNEGAAALAKSRNLANLLELDLGNADVKDAGAIALAESPYLENLLRLNLESHSASTRPLCDATREALVQRFGKHLCL